MIFRNGCGKEVWSPYCEAGLLLGSSNPHPSHWPLSFPLDPLLIIIHLANPIHVLWTLSSSPNSHHPPNPTNPGGGLKFVDLHLLESTYINRKKFHFCRTWIPRIHFLYLILNPNKNRPFYQNFKLKIIY